MSHYSYPRIVQGLKIRSAQTAELVKYWSDLRITDPDLIERSLLKSGYKTYSVNTQLDVPISSEQTITRSEALGTYLTLRGASAKDLQCCCPESL